ncbi:MAG: methyltransferase domain-containing protein, partial [Chloroflexi bacterium]|nr:methyltransferase domain-containing protein [Chloroflexota bacterium]
YYDLVTDFYEWGWGKSFHFAPRRRGESFKASLLRYEQSLADALSLKPDMQVLDAGCGVGGPMGNLARSSGAAIVGININAYQIERAKAHTRDVEALCSFIHGDFMQIPVGDDEYHGAYSIDALCYAPDKLAVYREIFRVLRPGACFVGNEWCVTNDFDPSNPEHMRVKEGIMTGSGLPDIASTAEVCDAMRAAGFELLEARDLAPESDPDTPWYRALQGRDFSFASLARTPFGRALTNLTLRVAEPLRLAPKGAREVSTFLNWGADTLVEGGQTGIFTPIYFFRARKPLRSAD